MDIFRPAFYVGRYMVPSEVVEKLIEELEAQLKELEARAADQDGEVIQREQ